MKREALEAGCLDRGAQGLQFVFRQSLLEETIGRLITSWKRGRLLNWQHLWLFSFQDSVDVACCLTIILREIGTICEQATESRVIRRNKVDRWDVVAGLQCDDKFPVAKLNPSGMTMIPPPSVICLSSDDAFDFLLCVNRGDADLDAESRCGG